MVRSLHVDDEDLGCKDKNILAGDKIVDASPPRPPTIAEIQEAVAEVFQIQLIDMTSDRTARKVARPRQIAMYLSRKLTRHSLPAIGRKFRRDHSTVSHAIKQIEFLATLDVDLGERVASLRERLDPGKGAPVR